MLAAGGAAGICRTCSLWSAIVVVVAVAGMDVRVKVERLEEDSSLDVKQEEAPAATAAGVSAEEAVEM